MQSSASKPNKWQDGLALAKPRITLLALITAVAGFQLAPDAKPWAQLFWTLAGIGTLVSGAGALNMFLERDSDAHMTRTRDRPLPSRRLSPDAGLGLGALGVGIAIPLLLFMVNALTAALGVFSLILYVLVYTPLKRYSVLALWIGAVPGAMPPLMGWTAATGTLAPPGWILFAIIFFWQIPHFLAIGLFRRSDYAAAGLKLFPQDASLRSLYAQMLLTTLACALSSSALYYFGYAGLYYFILASLLNAMLIVFVLLSFWKRNSQAWARKVFFASLIYLTLLFVGIFFDH